MPHILYCCNSSSVIRAVYSSSGDKRYVFYFENRSYFTLLFCINKETKNLLQPQGERPKSVSDQLFWSNGLKTRTCFLSCSSFLAYSLRATWIFRSQWLMVSRVSYCFIFSGLQCCFGHSKPASLEKCLQGYKVVWNTVQLTFSFLKPRLHWTLTVSRIRQVFYQVDYYFGFWDIIRS